MSRFKENDGLSQTRKESSTRDIKHPFWGEQGVLPGMDKGMRTILAIQSLGSKVNYQEENKSRREAYLETIHLVQDNIWSEHTKGPLKEYERAFSSMIFRLEDAPPKDVYKRLAEHQLYALWHEQWQFLNNHSTRDNSPVQLITTVDVMMLENAMPEDLSNLQAYKASLQRSQNYPEELRQFFSGKKRDKRDIPQDALMNAWMRSCKPIILNNIHELYATVVAKIPGSEGFYHERLFSVSIQPEWHDPTVRPRNLRHADAEDIMAQFARKAKRNSIYEVGIDPNELSKYLQEQTQIHDNAYQTLEEINTILAEFS